MISQVMGLTKTVMADATSTGCLSTEMLDCSTIVPVANYGDGVCDLIFLLGMALS